MNFLLNQMMANFFRFFLEILSAGHFEINLDSHRKLRVNGSASKDIF